MQRKSGTPALPIADVRAVVFDAVGTLLDPDPPAPAVYEAVGRKFGSRLEAAEIATRFVAAFAQEEAVDHEARLRTSEAREEERWRHIVARVLDDVSDPEACFRELFGYFSEPTTWTCAADAAMVLEALAGRGLVLGLASNYDSRLRRVVAGLPALKPLRHLVISSEVGWRKPAPEFFAAVCRVTGFPPANLLYIGDDRVNDYDAARIAGLRAVLFDPKGTAPSAVQRISRLRDLLG
ncbi:MAG TPA: HAD-IA family hydrolase [Gemmataceae bacterium]|jgi:putative hydrolase of the HAD superfamily|nr:HAD-IA family hydrolase [Gemmataceae bacterium]